MRDIINPTNHKTNFMRQTEGQTQGNLTPQNQGGAQQEIKPFPGMLTLMSAQAIIPHLLREINNPNSALQNAQGMLQNVIGAVGKEYQDIEQAELTEFQHEQLVQGHKQIEDLNKLIEQQKERQTKERRERIQKEIASKRTPPPVRKPEQLPSVFEVDLRDEWQDKPSYAGMSYMEAFAYGWNNTAVHSFVDNSTDIIKMFYDEETQEAAQALMNEMMNPENTYADWAGDAHALWYGEESVPKKWQDYKNVTPYLDAMGEYFKLTYGTEEGFKTFLATDPWGAFGDLVQLATLPIPLTKAAIPAKVLVKLNALKGMPIVAGILVNAKRIEYVTDPLSAVVGGAMSRGAIFLRDIPSNRMWSLEIEVGIPKSREAELKKMLKRHGLELKGDASIRNLPDGTGGPGSGNEVKYVGVEFVVSEKKGMSGLEDLRDVMAELEAFDPISNDSMGMHAHIDVDRDFLTQQERRNVVAFHMLHEADISGMFPRGRQNQRFTKRMWEFWREKVDELARFDQLTNHPHDKYWHVNTKGFEKKTIEHRQHHAGDYTTKEGFDEAANYLAFLLGSVKISKDLPLSLKGGQRTVAQTLEWLKKPPTKATAPALKRAVVNNSDLKANIKKWNKKSDTYYVVMPEGDPLGTKKYITPQQQLGIKKVVEKKLSDAGLSTILSNPELTIKNIEEVLTRYGVEFDHTLYPGELANTPDISRTLDRMKLYINDIEASSTFVGLENITDFQNLENLDGQAIRVFTGEPTVHGRIRPIETISEFRIDGQQQRTIKNVEVSRTRAPSRQAARQDIENFMGIVGVDSNNLDLVTEAIDRGFYFNEDSIVGSLPRAMDEGSGAFRADIIQFVEGYDTQINSRMFVEDRIGFFNNRLSQTARDRILESMTGSGQAMLRTLLESATESTDTLHRLQSRLTANMFLSTAVEQHADFTRPMVTELLEQMRIWMEEQVRHRSADIDEIPREGIVPVRPDTRSISRLSVADTTMAERILSRTGDTLDQSMIRDLDVFLTRNPLIEEERTFIASLSRAIREGVGGHTSIELPDGRSWGVDALDIIAELPSMSRNASGRMRYIHSVLPEDAKRLLRELLISSRAINLGASDSAVRRLRSSITLKMFNMMASSDLSGSTLSDMLETIHNTMERWIPD